VEVTVEFLIFMVLFGEFSLALLMNVQWLAFVCLAIVELFNDLVLLALSKTPRDEKTKFTFAAFL